MSKTAPCLNRICDHYLARIRMPCGRSACQWVIATQSVWLGPYEPCIWQPYCCVCGKVVVWNDFWGGRFQLGMRCRRGCVIIRSGLTRFVGRTRADAESEYCSISYLLHESRSSTGFGWNFQPLTNLALQSGPNRPDLQQKTISRTIVALKGY